MTKSKQRGTKAETDVRNYLRGLCWPHARRLTLAGAKDPGDISLGDGIPVTVEVKDCATYRLSEWLTEAHTERDNNQHRVGLVWFKRRGKGSPGDWFVLMDGRTVTHLLAAAGYVPPLPVEVAA
jgi:hypothetical protein